MTASRIMYDTWPDVPSGTLDRTTSILQKQETNGLPAGKRNNNPVLLYSTRNHLNVAIALALPRGTPNLESQIGYWLDAKLTLANRMVPVNFGSYDPNGARFVRFDESSGIGAAMRDWQADLLEEAAGLQWVDETRPDGIKQWAVEARANALPDSILPGATLGDGLAFFLDRLASPEGKPLLAAIDETQAFNVTLAWGGFQPASAVVDFWTRVGKRHHLTGKLIWHYVQWAGTYVPNGQHAERSPFRRTVSIPALAFMRMAKTWALTKAALAAAESGSSSIPPTSGSVRSGSRDEGAALEEATPSKAPTRPKRKARRATNQNPLGSGFEGRSATCGCARTGWGSKPSPSPARSNHAPGLFDFDHV